MSKTYYGGQAVIEGVMMKGKNIYFTLHTAAEMIVKINGKYVGGVDPNRERFLLNPYFLYGFNFIVFLSLKIPCYNQLTT